MGENNRYIFRQIDFEMPVEYLGCIQFKVEVWSSGENLRL